MSCQVVYCDLRQIRVTYCGSGVGPEVGDDEVERKGDRRTTGRVGSGPGSDELLPGTPENFTLEKRSFFNYTGIKHKKSDFNVNKFRLAD